MAAASSSSSLVLLFRMSGSHSGGYEVFYFLDITPRSLLKANRRFGGTYRLNKPSKKPA
jgi:hypothetical protein